MRQKQTDKAAARTYPGVPRSKSPIPRALEISWAGSHFRVSGEPGSRGCESTHQLVVRIGLPACNCAGMRVNKISEDGNEGSTFLPEDSRHLGIKILAGSLVELAAGLKQQGVELRICILYTYPSPRD